MAINDLVLTPPQELRPTTASDLLSLALKEKSAIDVIERVVALRREELVREALIDFNDALNRIQNEIKRIAPDMDNPDKKNKWASYAAIDRVIRPIYSREGMSLSFNHADSPKPDHLRTICRVSLRAHVEVYQIDMPVDTKGPKGGDVMTATHATGASDSYAKRYLVKDIFNIAIGEEDRDGNPVQFVSEKWLQEQIAELGRCETNEGLTNAYTTAANVALNEAKDIKAFHALKAARDARKKVMGW